MLPPIFPSSTYSIVNTQIVSIKVDDPGQVHGLVPSRGGMLEAGEPIAHITRDQKKVQRDLASRQFALAKLQTQLAELNQAIDRRETRLQAAKQAQNDARSIARIYLTQKADTAAERVRIAEATLQERQQAEARVAPLFKDGIVTAAQWSETRTRTLEAEKTLMAMQTEHQYLQQELHGDQAAIAASELAGGTGSPAFYEQEIEKLRLQRAELEARADEMTYEQEAAKSYLDTDRSYELTTPVSGMVWRRLVVEGENVEEGQTLVQVADTAAPYVEAYFNRHFFNRIAIGDRATVFMMSSDRFITGRVIEVQVQEQTTTASYNISAAAVDSSMLRVLIEVPPGELGPREIGQLTRVLVSSAHPGLWERLMIHTSFMLRRDE